MANDQFSIANGDTSYWSLVLGHGDFGNVMRDILRQLIAAIRALRPVAWCRLVETRGSTPQKAGAAMLVYDDGSQAGTLGGGCVEAEVKRRALDLLAANRAEVCTFQLDSDYGWGGGVVCGGRGENVVEALAPGR